MNELNVLARRVEQLEAIDAIKALKYRYLNACDEKRPEQVLACFAPGPVAIDFGHIGQFDSREAFVEVFKELGCHEHIVDMHHAQNPLVELQGADRATAKICLRFLSLNTRDKTRIQLGGHYDDHYQRVDGEWLITASRFTVTAVEMQDFAAGQSVVTYAGSRMPDA
ncbi:nuclear transport factor 2 family protein [Parahaliea mediterranea]|uniref:Nuclear transport factor 2 family protein n=1 Tax=Parahaliea mediterranea TaxID=651086 RepID=A0A939DD44_9GAMM|nr:nuclear transport factor 2 family protein [Parahaliea mediterranea]MBN7796040.1 nuclear transport factor 2 family protein [Parahaliea mediterranea]